VRHALHPLVIIQQRRIGDIEHVPVVVGTACQLQVVV
jgi:hypothetical protein